MHSDGRIKGLAGNIDPTKPPKNFKEAMGREDSQEWAEACDAGHQAFTNIRPSRPEDQSLEPRSWEQLCARNKRL